MSRMQLALAALATIVVGIFAGAVYILREPTEFPDYKNWGHMSAACNELKIVVTVYQRTPNSLPIIEYTDQSDQIMRVWYFREHTALVSIPSFNDGKPIRVDVSGKDAASNEVLDSMGVMIEPDEAKRAEALYQCHHKASRIRLELDPRWS